MIDLPNLVCEALGRRREARSGCFVHNAAASELLEYGMAAVSAIETEVLKRAKTDSMPQDLGSVMVIYSRLVCQFQAVDRCITFMRHLPPRFRHSALMGVSIAWPVGTPEPGVLPEALRRYLTEIATTGTPLEQNIAMKILCDPRIPSNNQVV